MAQNVVAHFVAEIGEHFIGGFLRESGVPNDDALRGAEAVDGSVGGDGLVAGLHPEHALGRNFLAGAPRDALELGDKLRGLRGERLIFIEERVDYVGRDEETKQKERQRDDPKIEPPAARAVANDGVKNPGEQAADYDDEKLGLGPIGNPRGPGLDGDFVEPRNGFLKDVEGKMENGNGQDEERNENESLKETIARNIFSPITIFRGK